MKRIFKKFDFFANDKFAVGIAIDTHEFLLGIDVTMGLPGTLVQFGVGIFCLYFVTAGERSLDDEEDDTE